MSLATLVLLALVLGRSSAASAQAGTACIVAKIVDGDTFYCRDGVKVRPIGFDTPERGQGEIYALARAALRRLADVGDTVRLELDVDPTDRYGRRLAWVWRDSVLINEAMIAGGWGMLYTVPPNVRYTRRLEIAQQEARAAGAGLWGRAGFVCPPGAHRRRQC